MRQIYFVSSDRSSCSHDALLSSARTLFSSSDFEHLCQYTYFFLIDCWCCRKISCQQSNRLQTCHNHLVKSAGLLFIALFRDTPLMATNGKIWPKYYCVDIYWALAGPGTALSLGSIGKTGLNKGTLQCVLQVLLWFLASLVFVCQLYWQGKRPLCLRL